MKQVIVMRKDLNMRKGKMIAQGAHASVLSMMPYVGCNLTPHDIKHWIVNDGMVKICVGVGSLDELQAVMDQAVKANLRCCMVTDAGHTEFHGESTITCCAIGPDDDAAVDAITGQLKLL